MDSKLISSQNNNSINNQNSNKSQSKQQQTTENYKSVGANSNTVKFKEKNNEIKIKTNSNNQMITSNKKLLQKRPLQQEPLNFAQSVNTNQSANQKLQRIKNKRTASNLSADNSQKKILRWHLWWDGSQSNLHVPSFPLPNRNVSSKIRSLEKINHKPGGGNVPLVNEKLNWNKVARTDHLAKGYQPSGGNKTILNEKLSWRSRSKIGSLENYGHIPGGGNVHILDQPFDKNGIRSRIDSGFIYEEVLVPIDYQIKPSPRRSNLNSIDELH